MLTAGVTATFTEGQTGPTLLDSGLTLTDSDPIANATVSVSGFKAGDALLFGTVTGATLGAATTTTVAGDTVITETLTFSDGTITATFDETAGTLTSDDDERDGGRLGLSGGLAGGGLQRGGEHRPDAWRDGHAAHGELVGDGHQSGHAP